MSAHASITPKPSWPTSTSCRVPFKSHGPPLALYVDYHSFFFTNTPDAFTQLGAALHFYGVALRYAPTPQAKCSAKLILRAKGIGIG